MLKPSVATAALLCMLISHNTLTAFPKDASNVKKTPPMCLLCKCEDHVVHCNNATVQYEFTRADAWPAGVQGVSFTRAALKTVPSLPVQLRDLHSLSLSHNALTSLPKDAFQQFHGLAQLNLAHNGLERLSVDAMSGNVALKELRLDHNNFEVLEWESLTVVSTLEELSLQHNNVRNLSGSPRLRNLKMLNLSSNILEEFPEETALGLPALEFLDLSDNQITTVPGSLQRLQTLKVLMMNGNLLTTVPDGAFSSLGMLTTLSLTRLPHLTKVAPDALVGLRSLTTLKISHNPRLVSLDRKLLMGEDAAQRDWPLKEVDLSYNGFRSIPKDLAIWDMLEWVDLQGNPWDCECSAQWMLDTLIPLLYSKNSFMLMEVRCLSPYHLQKKRMVHWLNHDPKRKVFCDGPAESAPLVLLEAGSSHGMLIALTAVVVVAFMLLVLGFVLQRRFDMQRRALATKMGRCRSPRNGSVRLKHPSLGI